MRRVVKFRQDGGCPRCAGFEVRWASNGRLAAVQEVHVKMGRPAVGGDLYDARLTFDSGDEEDVYLRFEGNHGQT